MAERWRSAVWPLATWAAMLGALAGVQAGFGGRSLPVLLQTGAAVLCGLVALAIALLTRIERRHFERGRPITELSLPTALAGVSLACVLNGTTVGSWLIIGGVLGLALSVSLLWRGRRAIRGRRGSDPVEAGR
jgi:hypothetical protein